MSDIIKDKYNLSYSQDFSIIDVQEQVVDVDLQVATDGDSSVIGHVTDNNGDPINGVTIKLFDKNGIPYRHTITDEKGDYVFTNLLSENYSITAVKKGIIITVPTKFFLQASETKTNNFNLDEEPTLKLCTIAGHILGDEGKKLSSAIVSLVDEQTGETISSTISAEDGEYVFYDVVAKAYKLIATKDGYSKSHDTEVTARNNTVVNIDINLEKNPLKNVGTISGIIRNNNIVVENAFVGLYSITKVDEKYVETLIATTKTNANGLYMFGDVVSGNYKVKAKQNK